MMINLSCNIVGRTTLHAAVLIGLAVAYGTPCAAATVTVAAGENLQSALDNAQPGDTIVLASGALFAGEFVLPAKLGTTYITITTGSGGALPGPGVRTGPGYTTALAKLQGVRGPALRTAAGAHHWRVENLELSTQTSYSGTIIQLGDNSQTSLAQVPHHIVLDRLLVRGNAAQGQRRGIELNSASTDIVNSYIDNIKQVGYDTQAICGWNGPGPFLIENNHLEAAGENVMFGGADPKITNLVPSDITVRRNYLPKSLTWKADHPSYSGTAWTVKNSFELKNAQRVLIEGNLFEYVWAQGQGGVAVVFTPRNQDGTAPWSVVRDVTFQHNIVRNAGAGVTILGRDDNALSAITTNISIRNNLFYQIGGAFQGSGRLLMILNAPNNVTVDHNTIDYIGSAEAAAVMIDCGGCAPIIKSSGFVFKNNFMKHSAYGVFGSGYGTGLVALSAYFVSPTFLNNVLAHSADMSSLYPASTLFPTLLTFEASFVDKASGNFRLVSSSPYRQAATDGGDIGVNMDALQAAQGMATSGSAPAVPGHFRILN